MAAIAYLTDEMIDDAYDFNMIQEIVSQFARAIGDEEDRVLIAGSGTAQPTGLTSCTITTVACAGNLDFDDIYNLVYSLPARYRQSNRASFLVNTENVREMRKLKDTNGRYLWQEPLSVDQPVTFNGFRLYENSYVPASEIYFGDFYLGYWMGDRQEMTVRINDSNETSWTKDLTGVRVKINCAFKFFKRLIAKTVNCWDILQRTISNQALA